MTALAFIARLTSLAEIAGATERLQRDGGLTEEARQALATRAAEIQLGRR